MLEHGIGGVPRQDVIVDDDRSHTGFGPNLVIALAMAKEGPAVTFQDCFQLLAETLNHSGGDVERAFVVRHQPQPVRGLPPFIVEQAIGVKDKEVRK